MEKLLWFDTETTGLNSKENCLIQIAGIIEIDREVKKIFEFKCQPFPDSIISEQALKINNLTLEEIESWQSPYELYTELKEIFENYINKFDKYDKFIIAGHNITFDYDFLDSFFRKIGDKYLGSYINSRARLDTKEIANFLKILGKLDTENIRLRTLCESFDIKINNHEALSDIKANRELFKFMMRKINEGGFHE